MDKLNQDQIQFIETYLENSDVFYADIRMEMTDHVASAIEKRMQTQNTDDFYSVFKAYMLEHKANLLESNKTFLRNVDKSIFKRFGKQLLKTQTLVFFLVLTFISYTLMPSVDSKLLIDIAKWFPFFSIVPFLIVYFGSLRAFKISRFSGIERLAFAYMIFFQFLNLSQIFFKNLLESNSNNYIAISILVSLTITITLVLLQLTYRVINDYRKQFKYIG